MNNGTRANKLGSLYFLTTFVMSVFLQGVEAQGTAFTYQGLLNVSGKPANGSYDVQFSLFNTNVSGAAIAGPVTNTAVAVTNGLFIIAVDFGTGFFTNESDWLQLAVSTNGANSFTTLVPRQQITPVPYAIYSATANSANFAVTAATAGSAASVPATGIGAGTANINISGNAAIATTAATAGFTTNAAYAGTATNALNFTNAITDAQLSANIARLDGTNLFTGTNIFKNAIIATNPANQLTGNGSGLTGLNASAISSGTIPAGILPANTVTASIQTNYTLFPTQTNSYAIVGSVWGNFTVTNNTVLEAIPTNAGILIYTGINTNGEVTYMCFDDPSVTFNMVYTTWSLSTNYPALASDNNVYGIPQNANVPLGAYTNGLGLGGEGSYGYSIWYGNFMNSPGPLFGFVVYGLDYSSHSSATNLPVPLTQFTTTNGGTLQVRTTSSYDPGINNGQIEVAFYDAVDNYPYVGFNYDNYSNGSHEGFLNFVGVASQPYGEIGGFQGFMSKITTPLYDNGSIVFDARDPVGASTNDAGSFITFHSRSSVNPANPDGISGHYNIFMLVDNYGRVALSYPFDPTAGASSNSVHFPFRVSITENTNVPALGFVAPNMTYSLGAATNGGLGFDGRNFYGAFTNVWTPIVLGQAGTTNLSAATTAVVLFDYIMPNTNYTVALTGEGAALSGAYVSAKTRTNFTAVMSAFTGILNWTITAKTQ